MDIPEIPKFVSPQVLHKGDKNGECNRRGCSRIAVKSHEGTRRWYCAECSFKINTAAGKKLCVDV